MDSFKKRITNTQYLKVGTVTNVGIVSQIYDNKNFKTLDGWSHNLDLTAVYKQTKRRAEKCY